MTRRRRGSRPRSRRAACSSPTPVPRLSGCWPTPRATRRALPPGRAGTTEPLALVDAAGEQRVEAGQHVTVTRPLGRGIGRPVPEPAVQVVCRAADSRGGLAATIEAADMDALLIVGPVVVGVSAA